MKVQRNEEKKKAEAAALAKVSPPPPVRSPRQAVSVPAVSNTPINPVNLQSPLPNPVARPSPSLVAVAPPTGPRTSALTWPIGCSVGSNCEITNFPDLKKTGTNAFCKTNAIFGHEGTDIAISMSQMISGVPVLAAAAGKVLWVFDGKYDGCPALSQEDCHEPTTPMGPGKSEGTRVCTPMGPYCKTGEDLRENCYWCFNGGNVIVILHPGVKGVFATRYDHLKRNSIKVKPGDSVNAGQIIAAVGSAGHSTAPHLHFEVWGTGFYELVDPWSGPCDPPGVTGSLFEKQPNIKLAP